jgi:hypothetical protein
VKKRKSRKKRKRNLQNTPTHMHVQPDSLLVSIKAAARMLNRCEATIFNLMRDGQLKALKSGRRTVIPVSSLHEYIASLPVREPGEWSGKTETARVGA